MDLHTASLPLISLLRGKCVERNGWMHKLSGRGLTRGWKRRYFLLRDGKLFYFKTDKPEEPVAGIINLGDYQSVKRDKACKRSPYCFWLEPHADEQVARSLSSPLLGTFVDLFKQVGSPPLGSQSPPPPPLSINSTVESMPTTSSTTATTTSNSVMSLHRSASSLLLSGKLPFVSHSNASTGSSPTSGQNANSLLLDRQFTNNSILSGNIVVGGLNGNGALKEKSPPSSSNTSNNQSPNLSSSNWSAVVKPVYFFCEDEDQMNFWMEDLSQKLVRFTSNVLDAAIARIEHPSRVSVVPLRASTSSSSGAFQSNSALTATTSVISLTSSSVSPPPSTIASSSNHLLLTKRKKTLLEKNISRVRSRTSLETIEGRLGDFISTYSSPTQTAVSDDPKTEFNKEIGLGDICQSPQVVEGQFTPDPVTLTSPLTYNVADAILTISPESAEFSPDEADSGMFDVLEVVNSAPSPTPVSPYSVVAVPTLPLSLPPLSLRARRQMRLKQELNRRKSSSYLQSHSSSSSLGSNPTAHSFRDSPFLKSPSSNNGSSNLSSSPQEQFLMLPESVTSISESTGRTKSKRTSSAVYHTLVTTVGEEVEDLIESGRTTPTFGYNTGRAQIDQTWPTGSRNRPVRKNSSLARNLLEDDTFTSNDSSSMSNNVTSENTSSGASTANMMYDLESLDVVERLLELRRLAQLSETQKHQQPPPLSSTKDSISRESKNSL